MAFGSFETRQRAAPMADINMTPLIDVMLVLLVIFIITAPLFTHAIGLDLPNVAAAPVEAARPAVTVSIDGAGRLYWNDAPLDAAALRARLAAAANAPVAPDVELRADQTTPYRLIAAVLSAAQEAGVSHLGFVVAEPDAAAKAATPPGTAR